MSENQARQEWHCLDPDCDWKLVETRAERLDLDAVPWRGSILETTLALSWQASDLRETAMAAHIRDDHGARDPMAWAVEMVERVRAAEEAKPVEEPPGWYH